MRTRDYLRSLRVHGAMPTEHDAHRLKTRSRLTDPHYATHESPFTGD